MDERNAAGTGTDHLEDWWIYTGTGSPHDGIDRLPQPPGWRRFSGGPVVEPAPEAGVDAERRLGAVARATTYRIGPDELDIINSALYLRRPLLVTGKPGTGKSTLAWSIAHELRLGPVLHWPITSRVTLKDGQYEYDAIGRLQEANLGKITAGVGQTVIPDIGRYIRLGPLGTALLPQERPRVLLIDELDKSDIDLPNDLLNIFEEGRFEIPELRRPGGEPMVEVTVHHSDDRVPVHRGHVICRAFPIVVITSNGEREFPPAFIRRCVRLDLRPPDPDRLARIVAAHLGADAVDRSGTLIEHFLERREHGDLATDQLLNAIYLSVSGVRSAGEPRSHLVGALLRTLGTTGPE